MFLLAEQMTHIQLDPLILDPLKFFFLDHVVKLDEYSFNGLFVKPFEK